MYRLDAHLLGIYFLTNDAVETFKALLKIKKEFFYEKFCFIFGHCCKISQEMEGVGTGQGLK